MNSPLIDPGVTKPLNSLHISFPVDMICFSHLRWDFVTQRPQHLMLRACRAGRVFFWEEPVWHPEGELPLQSHGELGSHLEVSMPVANLYVVRPHLTWGIDFEAGQKELLGSLIEQYSIEKFHRWYYSPMAFRFSSHLHSNVTIYDCMDELTGFRGAHPELFHREQELFRAADVVFTGGESLYAAKRKQHGNVYAFPSSVDAAHFAKAKDPSAIDPIDQVSIPHPRAGFFGVLDERMDVDLLAEIARRRPGIHFVILGPVVKIETKDLPRAKNIHYLGSKSYDDLPGYLSGWDVAMLPFAMNDSTRFISPTKTPEYLAAGKAVVSTPIQDVIANYGDKGLVGIAGCADEFVEAIDRALAPQPAWWYKAVAFELSRNSWDITWAAMNSEIERVRIYRETHSLAGFLGEKKRKSDGRPARFTLDGAGVDTLLASLLLETQSP